MTDDVTQRMVELEDGGVLEVHLVNWSTTPDDAPVAVDLHGTPSWGRPAGTTRAAAAARGVRLVAPTRAGYSTSSPAPGRDVAAVAADVAAVLDALGVGRVVVMGTSGGGPHALATAALLGDRVAAVASIAGVGPYGADGLDFLAGMGQDNIDEFGAALTGEGALRSYLEEQRAGLADLTPELLAQSWSSLLPPVDVAIVTGSALAGELVESIEHALAPGIQGWLEDDLAFCTDWGFSLDDLRCPVSVWQGGVDLMVPAAHGAWLAQRIPAARAHLLPDEGHLSIAVGKVGEVLDELLPSL
ncbi:alpha/beta fold hydrolase [Kineosporia sp. A_224]|uniref:alpha/beta fold hydrolase n=1 Tax=Kineosporia sp. A_224 TaxID=1962180 RepID=UPI0018E911A1|nr:alpha/beta hydrolase [Kineosporia sp. A_224]